MKKFPVWSKAAATGALVGLAIFYCAYILTWSINFLFFAGTFGSPFYLIREALLWPSWIINPFEYLGLEDIGALLCSPIPLMVLGGLIGYAIKEKDNRSCTVDAVIVILFLINVLIYVGAYVFASYLIHT